MNIFYLQQEIDAIVQEIEAAEKISCAQGMHASDFLNAINYDGMPHSHGKTEAPFERYVIASVDSQTAYTKKLRDKLEELTNEIEKLREELNTLIDGLKSPKRRTIIRLRCNLGLSWESIGEKIGMDRRSVSRNFYKAFGEVPHK